MVPTSISILLLVFVAIALRQVVRIPLRIWQIMIIGAIAVLIFGQISPLAAWTSIDWSLIGFLFGVFIIGQALEQSGYTQHIMHFLFYKKERAHLAMLTILIVSGICSMFLMNDTIAIAATPIMLLLTRQQNYLTKPFLLALAFGITIGSVTSPIGNPQNLLIATQMSLPFISFFQKLFLPTIINLLIAYVFLRVYYRRQLACSLMLTINDEERNPKLARWTLVSFCFFIMLIIVKIVLGALNVFDLPFFAVSIVAMLPILLFSRERFSVVKHIDWGTLIFFVGLFILMTSVWQSGYFQSLFTGYNVAVHHTISIMTVSVLYSQIISNVPLVALYLPILHQGGVHSDALLALAAGSTLAGNFFVLGAASNFIIMQVTEKHKRECFSLADFTLIGVPLTIVNCAVVYLFLIL